MAFDFEKLEMAQIAYKKLKRKTEALMSFFKAETNLSEESQLFLDEFKKQLADDLNTSNAMSVLYDVIKSKISNAEKAFLINQMDSVLSLNLLSNGDSSKVFFNHEDVSYIEGMLARRRKAKEEKNWAIADAIRDDLKEKGFEIKDTPEGTIWKKL